MNAMNSKPDSFADLPVSDLKIRRAGFLIIFVVFGIFGGWAALAPIDGAVHAPGVVTVQTYRKTVSHLEGGIVKEILVRDGDTVKKGDPLIVLDDSQLRAEYEVNHNALIAAQAMEARLVAERDDLQQIDFSSLTHGNDQRSQDAQTSEQQLFEARRAARLGQIAVLQERVGQLEQQIKGIDAMITTKKSLETSYRGEIQDLRDLLKDGFVDKQRLLDSERRLDMLHAEVADHRSTITKTRLQINETQQQILQINKDFQSDVSRQLAEIQTRTYELQERTAALQDRLNRIVIRSPDDGMVIGMTIHTMGGTVRPSTPLLDIVPSVSELIVEAEVPTNDINRIAIGRETDLRFSAFNAATTPVITGEVVKISGDRLVNEKTGVPYYLTRIKVTPEGIKKLEARELKLMAGMPADVLIKTGERTLLQYILQPARNAIAQSMIEE